LAAQALAQRPQFWMSEAVLVQTPLHSDSGSEQTHAPASQLFSPPHALSQVPQWSGSVVTSTQPPAQLIVPAGVWQGGRVLPGGEWNLCGTTMAPGFDPSDYAGGDRDELIAAYPAFAGFIRALTRLESPSQMSA
jgi:hypothetical protein